MDSRGVKTELVERLKAALEGKIEDQEAELTVVGGEGAETPREAAEVDCEKTESLGADEAGGQEHLGRGERDQSEVGESLGNVIGEEILNNREAAGVMSGEDATVKEPKVDLEEAKEDVKDDGEKVPEDESAMEKGSNLEKKKVDETQELTEENPVDQTAPIGLRELRFVLNNDFELSSLLHIQSVNLKAPVH